jgi:hypothetical protein
MWDIAGLPLKPVEGYNEDALRGYNPETEPAPPAPCGEFWVDCTGGRTVAPT